MGIERGKRKIINYDFVQGQGNPPSCQRFKVVDSYAAVQNLINSFFV